jgi:FkbM family methyltransferase
MTFISYSQNFEDVMLWRALSSVRRGCYIDVGAHHPTDGSVTRAFYDRGWSGVNVEPIPEPFNLLNEARPRDINLQICVGNFSGEIEIFDILPSGLATVKPGIAKENKRAGHSVTVRKVPVHTLEEVCDKHIKDQIHFLKIDVEGYEYEVLLGANFEKHRPWILVIESTYPNTQIENYSTWESIVTNAAYQFVYFDGLNRFYVAAEHVGLATHFYVPPNFFDDFALSSTCYLSRNVFADVQSAEIKIVQIREQVDAMKRSRSWRYTALLRHAESVARKLRDHGFAAWLHDSIKKILVLMARIIFELIGPRSTIKLRRSWFFKYFNKMSFRASTSKDHANYLGDLKPSSLEADRVYMDIKEAIELKQNNN